MLAKVEGRVFQGKKLVREFGPICQGIWSPKTGNFVRLMLDRIPLLEMLGSAARSTFCTKKASRGPNPLPTAYIYIYIYICTSSLSAGDEFLTCGATVCV